METTNIQSENRKVKFIFSITTTNSNLGLNSTAIAYKITHALGI
jgi:hypothetical protein